MRRPRTLSTVSGKALLAISFWGLSFVALRVAVQSFEPFAVVAIRMAIGAAFLYALLGARGETLLPRRDDRARCSALGLLLGFHLLIQTYAMRSTSAQRAGWLLAFAPVATVVGARAFLGERLSARGWTGVAIATIGVIAMQASRGGELRAGTGEALLLLSCATWAAYTLLSIGVVERNGSLRATALAMAIAAAPNLAVAAASGWLSGRLTPAAAGAVLFLGLCCSGIAFAAWNAALREVGATRASAAIYLQPFVTLAASIALLGESVSVAALAGGALVLLGVWRIGKAKLAARTAVPPEAD
jgi:drug/metabolite transporter (DMT)-like permease